MSQNFGNLASTLSGSTGSLDDDSTEFFLEEEGSSIGNGSSDSGISADSDFIFGSSVSFSLDLNVFIGSSSVLV